MLNASTRQTSSTTRIVVRPLLMVAAGLMLIAMVSSGITLLAAMAAGGQGMEAARAVCLFAMMLAGLRGVVLLFRREVEGLVENAGRVVISEESSPMGVVSQFSRLLDNPAQSIRGGVMVAELDEFWF